MAIGGWHFIFTTGIVSWMGQYGRLGWSVSSILADSASIGHILAKIEALAQGFFKSCGVFQWAVVSSPDVSQQQTCWNTVMLSLTSGWLYIRVLEKSVYWRSICCCWNFITGFRQILDHICLSQDKLTIFCSNHIFTPKVWLIVNEAIFEHHCTKSSNNFTC